MARNSGYSGYGRQGGARRVPLDLGRVAQAAPPPLVDPSAAAAPFETLGSVGASLFQSAQDQIQDQARTQIREIFTSLGNDELAFEDTWAGRTGDDRFTVADEARKFYADKRAAIEQDLSWSADARQAALDQLAAREQRGVGRALDFVTKARAVQKADSFKAAGLQLADFAAANWGDMPTVLERVREHLDDINASFAPEQAALLSRQVQDAALSSALLAAKEKDPRAALRMMESLTDPKTGLPLLGSETGRTVRDRIDTEIRVRDAQARAERAEAERIQAKRAAHQALTLAAKIDDAQAFAAATGQEPEGLPDLLAQYAGLGEDYAPKAAKAAKAVDMAREVHAFLREGERRDDGSFVPLAEQAARLEELKPKAQEGAAEAMERYDLARKGLAARVKEFESDPATWGLRQAAKEIAPAPGKTAGADMAAGDGGERTRQLLHRSLQIQEELLGRPGVVLPKDRQEELAGRWQAADADGRLKILAELDAFGPLKTRVLSEIKAPAAAQIAQTVLDSGPAAGNDARLILAASTAKPADIPQTDLKPAEIASAVSGSKLLSAVSQVARSQPYNAAYQEFLRDLQNSMENAVKMTGTKDGVQAFDRHLGVIASGDAAVFWPKAQLRDAPKLERALRFKRRDVGTFLEWQREAGMPETEWRERVRTIAERGMWVNAPDGNGFVLLNPTTGRAVTDRDGGYFRLTIGEAATMDTSAPEDPHGLEASD